MAINTHLSNLSNSFTLKSFSHGGSQRPETATQPSDALSKLQNKALESLAREIPGMESADLKSLSASEYTPEKIADRIGKFVALGLENARARGKSEDQIQALYDSAVKGVEQGFREVKEILTNLDVLNGGIAVQVEATEKATFDTLAGLSPSRRNETQGAVMTKSLAVAERYQRADDFSLTVKTRDGDLVKVNFSRELDAQGTLAMGQDGAGNRAAVMGLSRSDQSGYQFSVEGDLSTDEIDAIQNLVRDVGQVANDFFSGDVQKAFEQVSEVAFDGSQLASMNLHMSRTEQYSAAQRYQQTQQVDSPEQSRPGLRLGHLMHDFGDSFQKPALDFLDQVDSMASGIMQGLVEQDSRFKDATSEQQDSYRRHLDRLLGAVSRDV